ncbi:hypothetical protein VNO77_39490 [Canavalia gladiata]|uniref:Uncharacterized protein n=1 Tax=Canavalia gladiata TaxID=3824 RepID=A0AAN9KD71_CANGL
MSEAPIIVAEKDTDPAAPASGAGAGAGSGDGDNVHSSAEAASEKRGKRPQLPPGNRERTLAPKIRYS